MLFRSPSEAELAAARELLERLERAEAAGRGAYVLEDGRFVDHAVAAQARQTLALAALREEETV